jgi:hypothetical protein
LLKKIKLLQERFIQCNKHSRIKKFKISNDMHELKEK